MAGPLRSRRCHLLVTGLALVLALAAVSSRAQGVVFAGSLGQRKALLVIDGQQQVLAVGESARGVRLVRIDGDSVEVQVQGGLRQLRLGGTPAQLSATPRQPGAGAREVVLAAGPGGHFTAVGAINGRAVSFMVDTGATLVSLGQDEAQRLGIDLSQARPAMTQTANGAVPVQLVTLNTVRVGDLELSTVGAAVMPLPMPMVLLGNSFLARLQMRRENDQMRLEKR